MQKGWFFKKIHAAPFNSCREYIATHTLLCKQFCCSGLRTTNLAKAKLKSSPILFSFLVLLQPSKWGHALYSAVVRARARVCVCRGFLKVMAHLFPYLLLQHWRWKIGWQWVWVAHICIIVFLPPHHPLTRSNTSASVETHSQGIKKRQLNVLPSAPSCSLLFS